MEYKAKVQETVSKYLREGIIKEGKLISDRERLIAKGDLVPDSPSPYVSLRDKLIAQGVISTTPSTYETAKAKLIAAGVVTPRGQRSSAPIETTSRLNLNVNPDKFVQLSREIFPESKDELQDDLRLKGTIDSLLAALTA
jgi:hypothetical protein